MWKLLKCHIFLQKFKSFPGPKPIIPFLGSLEFIFFGMKNSLSNNFITDVYKYLDTLDVKYGQSGMYCAFAFNIPFVVLTNAKLIKKFFEKYGSFTAQNSIIQLGQIVAPEIMLVLHPDKWKERRKYLSSAFTTTNLKVFETIINRETKYMLREIDDYVGKGFVDIRELITTHVCLTTLDVLTQVYDRDYLHSEIKNVLKFIETAQIGGARRITNPLLWIPYFTHLTFDGLKLLYDEYLFSKIFDNFVSESKKQETLNWKSKNVSTLQQLIKQQSQDESLKDKTIFRELFGFLTAGLETSSFTIIGSLFYLGIHTEIQEKIREEVKVVFEGKSDSTLTREETMDMKLLEGVINEVMRLHPPILFIGVKAETDIEIEGQAFPKGTNIMIPLTVLHRKEEYFPDPHKFNPQRFWNSNPADFDAAFMPFGRGRRFCIGSRFAMLQMKIILANILHKYSFTTAGDESSFEVKPHIAATVVSEVNLMFKHI